MPRVTREIVIDAPPPTVWRHLSDPTERREWLGGDLDVDLVPGRDGEFVAPSGTRRVRVDDVDAGRSLTFTWGEGSDTSQVTIEVEPEGDASRVRVTETAPSQAVEDAAPATEDAAPPADDGPVASVVPLTPALPHRRRRSGESSTRSGVPAVPRMSVPAA